MPSLSKIKKEIPDPQLITNYKTLHDNSALGILFQRYSHLVFCICQKYLKNEEESKDAVMEIFEKLPKDLEKHEISNFKSWLYVVSKNHCLIKLRQTMHKTIVLKETEEIENIYFEEPHYNHNNERDVQKHNLGAALKKLNNKQKICIELFYFKKKSYKEIAEATDFAIHQVKSYIQNGRRNLKHLLA